MFPAHCYPGMTGLMYCCSRSRHAGTGFTGIQFTATPLRVVTHVIPAEAGIQATAALFHLGATPQMRSTHASWNATTVNDR